MDKTKDTLVNRILYIFMKYLYIIIFFPKYIQLILILFLVLLILKESNHRFSISREVFPIFLVGIINIISILLNLGSHHETSRILAAFNTAILWCSCGVVYTYVKNHNLDEEKIEKYMFNNICILVILTLLAIALTKFGITNVTIFSRNLMRTDWLYGIRSYRFKGFLLYDNLVSQMYFLSFPFAYSYIERKKKNIFKFLFLVISILPVVMCKSRMGIILSILSICILIPNTIVTTKKSKRIIYLLYGMIALILIGIKFDSITDKLFELINGRKGSTNVRMTIYLDSIKKSLESSPIIGCGIKDMLGDYPLGSHSTYIGLFYKTGFLGLVLGIIGILRVLNPLKKLPIQYKVSGICLVIMLTTGDLDGENWLIILFSILYGQMLANSKKIGQECEGDDK